MKTKQKRPGRISRPAKDLSPLGKLLRTLRGTITNEQAAAKVGKARDWWHRRETGGRDVLLDDAVEICAAFGCEFRVTGKGVAFD